MQKALITGGAGFIGSHLAESLLGSGWNVEIIDDLSTGRIQNIEHLKSDSSFTYVLDSVMKRSLMMELIDRADVIFHLAAAVGVQLIVQRPVYTIETNIKATELVLELAAKKRKTVLLTSSSEVYGKLEKEHFGEEDDLVLGATSRPRWCYAASKTIDEFLGKAYYREKGVPVVIVRIFNTIGPRQTGQYGMVVPRFVQQALRQEPLTVYGDGMQRRSFTWVGDVVSAVVALVQHPEAPGEVFNVGHHKDISIHELAKLIKEMTGSSSEVVFVPYEEAYEEGFEDMRRRLADTTKIRNLIAYRPSMDLREIIDRIIMHEKNQL